MPTPSHSTLPSTPAPLLVVCLCAAWCGACREYRPLFEQLQTEFPGARFLWVDIEDEADLVDPIEVENFPTLLLATGDTPRFFGTVTPHLDTLRRLILVAQSDGASTVSTPEVQQITQRLRSRP